MPIIHDPFIYITDLFDMDLMEHLVHQTNLNARQSYLGTSFKIDTSEMLVFLGFLICMSVVHLPSIEEQLANETRVSPPRDFG